MKSPLKKGDRLVASIDRLALGGEGVARSQGFVIFIPQVLPREQVEVEIVEVRKSFARGRVLNLIDPAPERQQPPCKLFGRCGGCDWQHMHISFQRQQKQALLEENLARTLGIHRHVPLISGKADLHYRNRIQMHWEDQKFHFSERGSHRLVATNDCPIADARLNDDIKKRSKEPRPPGRYEIYLNTQLSVECSETNYGGASLGFSQVNIEVNALLVSQAVRILKNQNPRNLLELYCGAGNFSFEFLSQLNLKNFLGIELSEESVRTATSLLAAMPAVSSALSVSNSGVPAQFIAAAGEDFDRHLKFTPDLIFLDPPRAGASAEVIQKILAFSPESLVYVSCDPASLLRDLRLLSAVYEIHEFIAFDMFPQTSHIESLVSLKKKKELTSSIRG